MRQRPNHLSINHAASRTGLEPRTIRCCIQIGLVSRPLTEDDLAELRRVRRLREINVNLAGVEIIVRMHHQIVALQTELADLRRRLENNPGEQM